MIIPPVSVTNLSEKNIAEEYYQNLSVLYGDMLMASLPVFSLYSLAQFSLGSESVLQIAELTALDRSWSAVVRSTDFWREAAVFLLCTWHSRQPEQNYN
jgi:hypothetical protein